jgi:saccharopine dehydrogenase (NAD+, L-lysine forming)
LEQRHSVADYNLERATEVQQKLGNNARFPVEKIDARQQAAIEALARKYTVDIIINSCDPSFNEPIFDAAFAVGAKYMDMALTLSEPHETKPFEECHVKLGDYQFARADAWEKAGNLAIVGMGVEPGMSNVFAKYAAEHLDLAEIDEIGVRDGSNIGASCFSS